MNIKKLRQEKGLTQKQLADKVGISRQHLNYIENGRYPLTKTMEIALKCILNES